MRALALAALAILAAVSAQARDCSRTLPDVVLTYPLDLRGFLDCIDDEFAALRRENARLREEAAALRAELAALPAGYLNEDGRVLSPPGRPVASARFVLSSRQPGSGAVSLSLDPAVVEALCARPGGCTLRLSYQAMGFGFDDPRQATAVGPCAFDYDPASGAWFAGRGCSDEAARGTDGTGSAEIAAIAGEGCILADADAARLAGEPFEPDRTRGLYLIARSGGEGRSGQRFRCDLVLE